jgi:hypothetical protein
MLSNYVISAIRTYVPLGVGVLLTWLASRLHVVIDPSSQAGLVALCVAVLSATYYALARLLEHRWPMLGVLLGVPAKPAYAALRADGAHAIANVRGGPVDAQHIPTDVAPIAAQHIDA